jgi:hypothetical protein
VVVASLPAANISSKSFDRIPSPSLPLLFWLTSMDDMTKLESKYKTKVLKFLLNKGKSFVYALIKTPLTESTREVIEISSGESGNGSRCGVSSQLYSSRATTALWWSQC